MSRRDNARSLVRAMRQMKAAAERERWPRERLRVWQEDRAAELIRHAAGHSPLLRGRLDPGAPLAEQPVMTKSDVADRFDELVCDRSLRSAEVLRWLEGATDVALHRDAYRVMATSGSSGRKGLFAYDRAGWDAIMAQFLRNTGWMGFRPRLPRRRGVAAVVGAASTHMSRQCTATLAVGLHRTLSLPASAPLQELVARLDAFQPDLLGGFPSVLSQLAQEQSAGRLHIAPSIVSTSSELRTPEATRAMREAWGTSPFDWYATTEGLWGMECEEHAGVHLFEDHVVVENVDEGGRPVPPGVRGAKLLVTNLANRVQPIIRMEVADCLTFDPDPCPCGRTLVRAQSIDGRADDVLMLPSRKGGTVAVAPIHFGVITADAAVREFQVRQEGGGLRVLVVSDDEEIGPRLRAAVGERLTTLGVEVPVAVERRAGLERVGGKLRMVVGEGRSRG